MRSSAAFFSFVATYSFRIQREPVINPNPLLFIPAQVTIGRTSKTRAKTNDTKILKFLFEKEDGRGDERGH
jgi:hypothetical protein